MKTKMIVLAALVITFALSISTVTPAAPSPNAIPAAANQPKSPAASPAAAPADHPEIRDALAALRRAKDHLEHAKHDYQGHRADAVRATDEAIRQLEICLKYDY